MAPLKTWKSSPVQLKGSTREASKPPLILPGPAPRIESSASDNTYYVLLCYYVLEQEVTLES